MGNLGELLEYLYQREANSKHLTPGLQDEIRKLKLEVKYILPYVESSFVTGEEQHGEIRRRFSIKDCPKHLPEFVSYMMKQTLLVKQGATEFYCSASVGKYDWQKCTDYILDNLQYVQSLEADQIVAVKKQVKAIEEKLRCIRSFCMLVAKRNFKQLDSTKAEIHLVYENMDSVSRSAAYLFHLIMVDNIDHTKLNLELSDLLRRINSAQLQAVDTYFEILEVLRLSWTDPCCVSHKTLCMFINSLQYILTEISRHVPPLKKSFIPDFGDILIEIEFLRFVLKDPLKGSMVYQILDAISTHIDVLATEALYINYLNNNNNNNNNNNYLFGKKWKINNYRDQIWCLRNHVRRSPRRDTTIYSSVDHFLIHMELLVEDTVLSLPLHQKLMFELKLLRMSAGDKETIDLLWDSWWDLRSHCFRKLSNEKGYFSLGSLLIKIQNKVNEASMLDLFKALMDVLNSDAYVVQHMKLHVETLLKELTVLQCILMDPLKHHCEEGLDDLYKDIKAGLAEAKSIIYSLLLKKFKTNTHFSGGQTIQRFRATVRQVYSKFAKLSPSKLLVPETGSFEYLEENLMELKNDNADPATFAGQPIGKLLDGLVICYSFLRDNAFKQNEGDELEQLRTVIKNVLCKVDNVIDTYEEVPDWFFEMRLSDVTVEVALIEDQIAKINGTDKYVDDMRASDEKAQKWKDKYTDEAKVSRTLDEEILGFDKEEEKLKRALTRDSTTLKIISVVGMPGLGKTTLASKVYKDVTESFHAHAWCYVSKDYRRDELLRNIISQINGSSSAKVIRSDEEDLEQLLHTSLMTKEKYLIVLDDIWDIKAWNALKRCFPPRKGSKILLTSRFKTICQQAGQSDCLEPELLSEDKSWQLLRKKVFGVNRDEDCPQELCAIGKEIAEKCGGLPLSIVVIAGVLKNMDMTETKWKEVAESLSSHLVNQGGVFKTVELSYNQLPFRMKQCFLYCGVFLKQTEIPKSKLVRLWTAERFIKETPEQPELEDVAEDYLLKLVDRSLLIVVKRSSDDGIKTCRIHDLLRDFCTKKAEDEKFLQIMNGWNCFPSWQRRLCFCSRLDYTVEIRSFIPVTPRTRSLIFVDIGHPELFDSSFNIQKFILLNVLDLGSWKQLNRDSRFPECITGLYFLRYLALEGGIRQIPSSVGKLLNLETLIIITGMVSTLELPGAVFNLTKLRHLLVDGFTLASGYESQPCLHNLRSISKLWLTGSSQEDEQVIRKFPNIRKLKCEGGWIDLSVLNSLSHLESLNVYVGSVAKMNPRNSGLPFSLKKLTLCASRLAWSEMETIAALTQLQVLKLVWDAFEGKRWDTSYTFPNLRYLRLKHLYVREWEASEVHFPKLKRLVVDCCRKLKSIPLAFSDIDELKSIEVVGCCKSVAGSAKQIKEDQRMYWGNKHFETIIFDCDFEDVDDDDV